jgi:hypothetical protein
MTIRTKELIGFKTKPGSNIVIKGNVLQYLSWDSKVCAIELSEVIQIEP